MTSLLTKYIEDPAYQTEPGKVILSEDEIAELMPYITARNEEIRGTRSYENNEHELVTTAAGYHRIRVGKFHYYIRNWCNIHDWYRHSLGLHYAFSTVPRTERGVGNNLPVSNDELKAGR